MQINLADKLKSLRKEKNISQEKLAQYLNVSYQAVSKWENSTTYPDISLLPEIARFFGITIDELLQAEQIDEEQMYHEYEAKTADLQRIGRISDTLPIWQEAYHRMPNNIRVKEMLMSAYFDTDKEKYQKEIVELGTEICHSDCGIYFKGQAIEQVARTYAHAGNMDMAERWAYEAHSIMHALEPLLVQITEDGEEMLSVFRFANYWYLNRLFYMGARLIECPTVPGGLEYTQAVSTAIAAMYELVFPNDDMDFENLQNLCMLHKSIAEDEVSLGKDESIIKYHLTRAWECAEKSMFVVEHDLNHPLVNGWHISGAPSDNKRVAHLLRDELRMECFDAYRHTEWFSDISERMGKIQ